MPKPGYSYYQNQRALKGIVFLGVLALLLFIFTYEAPSSEEVLEWYRNNRIRVVLAAAVLLALLVFSRKARRKIKTQRQARASYEAGSGHFGREHSAGQYSDAVEFVLSLEQYRIDSGYKPGWLYYRCVELNLVRTLEELRRSGQVESPWEDNAFERSEHQCESSERAEERPRNNCRSQDPYEILGVSKSATNEEIRRAYVELVKLYRPDRVHGLGKELQELANQMTVAINKAYERIINRN